MLTPYRQKYNPKKPRSKIKGLLSTVQVFFQKNFFQLQHRLEYRLFPKKSPSPFVNGEGRHQNTLHFKPSICKSPAAIFLRMEFANSKNKLLNGRFLPGIYPGRPEYGAKIDAFF